MRLKPCPFCNSEAQVYPQQLFGVESDTPKDKDEIWDIKCTSENCYLSEGTGWWMEKKEVIKLWNKRK